MSRLEATLLAMDQTDHAENNGQYLMSRPLDMGREEIPKAWEGQSRAQLLGRLEELALKYGKYIQSGNNSTLPMSPSVPRRLSMLPQHNN